MDSALPPLISSFFDYLRATLPSPLYSFAIGVFAHAYTAATALVTLLTSLIRENPLDWRAEAILPPIITIFVAYLALASLYRTASWAIRLSLFFLKWGTLIGVAMAIAGYLAGQGTGIAPNQRRGGAADVFSNMFGGTSNHKRQPNHRRKERPKPWQEWEFRHEPPNSQSNVGAQQLMDSIVGAAEGVLGGKWWSAAMNGFPPSTKETQSRGENGKTRSR